MTTEPSNGELERTIARNHSELATQMDKIETQLAIHIQQLTDRMREYVLREVWQTERDAQRKQIDDIENEVTSARRRAANSIYAALGSVIGSIVLLLIGRTGGH